MLLLLAWCYLCRRYADIIDIAQNMQNRPLQRDELTSSQPIFQQIRPLQSEVANQPIFQQLQVS